MNCWSFAISALFIFSRLSFVGKFRLFAVLLFGVFFFATAKNVNQIKSLLLPVLRKLLTINKETNIDSDCWLMRRIARRSLCQKLISILFYAISIVIGKGEFGLCQNEKKNLIAWDYFVTTFRVLSFIFEIRHWFRRLLIVLCCWLGDIACQWRSFILPLFDISNWKCHDIFHELSLSRLIVVIRNTFHADNKWISIW